MVTLLCRYIVLCKSVMDVVVWRKNRVKDTSFHWMNYSLLFVQTSRLSYHSRYSPPFPLLVSTQIKQVIKHKENVDNDDTENSIYLVFTLLMTSIIVHTKPEFRIQHVWILSRNKACISQKHFVFPWPYNS